VEADAFEDYRDSRPNALYHRVLVHVDMGDSTSVLASTSKGFTSFADFRVRVFSA
jgi:hypothetical protein